MGHFKFSKTNIEGILIIEARAFADARGFFMETYNQGNFAEANFNEKFVQDNLSQSSRGVLRGMHYQINPSPMGKLVSCVKGKIFDAGIDVRAGSATFGKWCGEILSDENKKMLYFPPGIAHGFLSLEDDTIVAYKCTGLYSKENETAMAWDDPDVAVAWPVEQVGGKVVLSDRDKVQPRLKDAIKF
ncbi:dTDP-4-dehydrorhamnose 3,5-epimerase [candidate division WOR-1 bacterium RIFCSPLOWO2_02_FULL_46_20]|uniref:dTDP-4-dehydrorhamnose 3,5-epimerase n=2 Tax=Saganbacteria TaxID=1703751 RepID=A0A1F4R402_UNCSA|nr:MAG: dTDP-4-dehydrorhamnose 3,5-epimerase [candidate division WOR-1 bacterium RIFCSPHIGHO2_02_FULL_45_12]OGC02928.1 MAG: dTDP-4-dehydrorhamnose 3,5-epimerase [candidate division WOR-1 bacterium RIFCSPLOWO2_02_FULL_46_20]OGC08557.1 MAG: dTDP-4-dehydrorhamnose 3,5-epimerase [candidate division WOR-1 bacterium RIFCSPLOWO2_12_FULL_45_9]